MSTWGKRCDVINFLTDTIVGGQLTGDKIDTPEQGYRPYWEYPSDTFPDNIIFINISDDFYRAFRLNTHEQCLRADITTHLSSF